MGRILYIETGTNTCSVAIAEGFNIIGCKESSDSKAHATQLSIYIENLLEESKTHISQLDAVTISKGPGSYTGLRIGVSVAKGICYAIEKPLISVGSLESMAWGASEIYQELILRSKIDLLCPMIDARRMEVYSALYSSDHQANKKVEALIINQNSFQEELSQHRILFFGNGASKCKGTIQHPNAFFVDDFTPSARFMIPLAIEYYSLQKFEDVAYFEPFYLKDFVATTSNKNIIPGLK